MKSIALIRLFAIGLIAAILLSLLSLFTLKRVIEYASSEHRRYFILSMATRIEERPLDENSLLFFSPKHRPPPPMMGGPPPPFPPPPFSAPPPPPPPRGGGGPFPPPPRLNLWLINEAGEVISSNSNKNLPSHWTGVRLPKEVHEVTSNESFFRMAPQLFIVKLDAKPTAYLISAQDEEPWFSGPAFASQTILTFATVCVAIFFSLFFTFIYLRRKSHDAKSVLLRLERGDLKARFEIKRVDEFGNLMLDFNRMADEIERLVHRIHETEKSRKNLLQELGHDLRTPLTGLTTAFETLKYHYQKINEMDREELFKIMGGEITYLRDLLEKLLTIATLDEPHYKSSTETIDLPDLMSHEIKSRQSSATGERPLTWSFNSQVSPDSDGTLLGDPHLIMRLLRNAFDNAAKYANHKVEVSLHETAQNFEILIEDDGPGLDDKAIEGFGKRRDYSARAVKGLSYSIGLGSVIMKAVAELHGGSVQIANRTGASGTTGAQLKIILPKVF